MLCEDLSLLLNIKEVWKNNSLKLEKIPFMKIYGITLIRGDYAVSGWKKYLVGLNLELLPVAGLLEDVDELDVVVILEDECVINGESSSQTRILNQTKIWH